MPDQITKAVRLADGSAWAYIIPEIANPEGQFEGWAPTDEQAEAIMAIEGVTDVQREPNRPTAWQVLIYAPDLDQLAAVYEDVKVKILAVFGFEDRTSPILNYVQDCMAVTRGQLTQGEFDKRWPNG